MAEFKKLYLISYNLTQCGLWAAVAFFVAKGLVADPRDYAGGWAAAGPAAKLAVGTWFVLCCACVFWGGVGGEGRGWLTWWRGGWEGGGR